MLGVERITSLRQIEPLAADWNRLAGQVPFRRWEWLGAWCRHYLHDPHATEANGAPRARGAPRAEPFVLVARSAAGDVIGVAPFARYRARRGGGILRLLGGDEACSDYVDLLAASGREADVTQAFADWLVQAAARRGRAGGRASDRWDAIELDGIIAGQTLAERLAAELARRGHPAHREPRESCWRIDLPPTWEEYLDGLSKSFRKQVRRLQRRALGTGRGVFRTVQDATELEHAWATLVDLHQRRRRSLDQRGCFASARFHGFLQEAVTSLLSAGRARLHSLELDGSCVAVDLCLLDETTTFVYQGGIEPAALDERPGTLIHAAAIRQAIDEGRQGFDFLRGDEPYKAHWRARPRPTLRVRVGAGRGAALVAHHAWVAARTVRRWLKGRSPLADVSPLG